MIVCHMWTYYCGLRRDDGGRSFALGGGSGLCQAGRIVAFATPAWHKPYFFRRLRARMEKVS